MDRSLELNNWHVQCADMIERDGFPLYRVKVYCRRDNEWVLSGMLDLRGDEWQRLQAVFQAHEATNGPIQTHASHT